MKKALFATTALVAFTGAAAAEVTISGSAEMGIVGGSRYATTNVNVNTNGINPTTTTTTTANQSTQFFNDVDIKFTLTGESDGGLSFGAVVDLDEAGNLGRARDNQGTSVFISGAFGSLTMGDTDGALDWALTDAGDIGNPGSLADDETTHGGYLGGYGDGYDFAGGAVGSQRDNQILRYDYSFDSFGVAISYEQGARSSDGVLFDGNADGAWAIGLKYGLDLGGSTVNLGAGYHSGDFNTGTDQTIWGLSASGSFGGGFSAGVVYSDWSDLGGFSALDMTHTGLGLGYTSGPISLHANYGVYDLDAGGFSGQVEGFGLAAAYDLGGGLSANLGYGNTNIDSSVQFLDSLVSGTFPTAGSNFGREGDTWSLGMSMSF